MPWPLSRWSTPEITGFGRLPMAAAPEPLDTVDAAVAGEASPWVQTLDGQWKFRLAANPDLVTPHDVGVDAPPATGASSPSPAPGRSKGTTPPSTSTCACRSRVRRRTCPPTTRPACTGAPSRSRRRGAAVARSAPRRRRQLDGLRVGQRRVRRARHGQPSAVDVRPHRRRFGAARTRSASSCRSGARRRGSRTRTSGGWPACTAASRWCRCRRSPSPTRRPCPASSPTAPLARSTSTSASTRSRRVDRAADGHRRGRLHDPTSRRRAPPASSGALRVPAWPQRDPRDPDAGAGIEHELTLPLARAPRARAGCACPASRRGTTSTARATGW